MSGSFPKGADKKKSKTQDEVKEINVSVTFSGLLGSEPKQPPPARRVRVPWILYT